MLGIRWVPKNIVSFAEGDHEIFFLGFPDMMMWFQDQRLVLLHFGHSLIEFHGYAACVPVLAVDCLTLEDNIWTTMSTSKSATWCHCIFGSKIGSHLLRFHPPSRCAWTVTSFPKGLKLHLVLSCKSWWFARILWIWRSSSERCGGLSSLFAKKGTISDYQIHEFRFLSWSCGGISEFQKQSQHLNL